MVHGISFVFVLTIADVLFTQKGLRSLSKPSAYVQLGLDSSRDYLTKIVQSSDSPSWGENFSILSTNPNKQKLTCQVKFGMNAVIFLFKKI